MNLRLAHPSQDYDLRLYEGCPESGGWAHNIGWARNIGEENIAFNIGSRTGWYTIAVTGYLGAYDPATPFTLQASFAADTSGEPNDACASAHAVTSGNRATGYLTSDADLDYFKINVTAPYSILTLDLFHPTADYDLRLYYGCDAGGGAARGLAPTRGSGGERAAFNIGTETGWYTIAVAGYDGVL